MAAAASIPKTDSEDEKLPCMSPPLVCQKTETLKSVIERLCTARIHRIFVVNDEEQVIGVVTLRDIIDKFVVEPKNYFANFFGATVDLAPFEAASAPASSE